MTLYGVAEIAAALNVTPDLVYQWRHRGKLPPPLPLKGRPVWSADDPEFAAWLEKRKKGPRP